MNARPYNPRLLASLLVLAAVVAFLPALGAGFIWDDDTLLTENPQMRTGHGLVEIWQGKNSRDYTPLTLSTFWVEYQLWGARPIGYHIVNILLHALAAVLLWRILVALRIPGAWLGALFFAIHPINAASVAWVAELKNTLSAVFFLGSILAFLHAYIRKDHGLLVASVALFLLAGLSKGAVVALPLVLAGCIWWMYEKITRSDLLRLTPFAVIALGVAWLTMRFQAHAENYRLLPDTAGYRIARAGNAVWWYLREILFPVGLSPIAPQWRIDLHSPVTWLPAFAVVAFLALFFWKRNTGARPLFFAYSYFLWMLLPVLGFVWMALQQETPAADWWQYMAAPGIFACFAAGFTIAIRDAVKGARLFLQTALGVVIALLFFQSWQRSMAYESMETYCLAIVPEAPHAWTLQNNLGVILKQRGQYSQAIAHYEQVLADNPRFVEARINLARALSAEKNYAKAEEAFQEALKLRPENPDLLASLAETYFYEGKMDEASLAQRHAITIDLKLNRPQPQRFTQFGVMLMSNKQFPEAIVCFKKALELEPGNIDTRINLIRALIGAGRVDDAATQCRDLLEIAHSTRDDKLVQIILPLLNQTTQSP